MNRRTLSRGERIGLGVLVVLVVCLCAAALVPGARHLAQRRAEIERRQLHVEELQQRVNHCRHELADAEAATDEWVERVARDELRLAKPGETILDFSAGADTQDDTAPRTPPDRSSQ